MHMLSSAATAAVRVGLSPVPLRSVPGAGLVPEAELFADLPSVRSVDA
jgi:hypothetical protein